MKRFEEKSWQENQKLRFDFNCMIWDYAHRARAQIAGAVRTQMDNLSEQAQVKAAQSLEKLLTPNAQALQGNFVTNQELQSLSQRLQSAYEAVDAMRGDAGRMMAWTELPTVQTEEVAAILQTAAEIRERFENFVVLGIGGSALGPIAVQQALNDLHYNERSRQERGGPRLYVVDNVDPERMVSLLNLVDVEKTCFNVISKSGNTSETMSQYLLISDFLKQKLGSQYASHIVVTTDKQKGNLFQIAKADGLTRFVVPDGVGGRFSELCPVGLLAAAVSGIDIEELLAGAAYMDNLCHSGDYAVNPALFGAAMMFLSMQKGMNISVMMPYSDGLRYMADWYAQLWAESLGKNRTRDGQLCQVGQTPVKALGVTDQHSQVQLYTEGPNDKLITFLCVEEYRRELSIPQGCESFPDVNFLCGHTFNELISAEQRATQYALLKAAKPSYTITLPRVNAFTVGQLLFYFELMTAYCGELLNIDAFDQPGVEEGKQATFALLGRNDYAYKQKEIDAVPQADPRFIL